MPKRIGRTDPGWPVLFTPHYAYGEVPTTQRNDVFAFNVEFTQMRYVNCWPKSVQRPHPPVWIPGGGSVETWDYCADNHFLYSYLSFSGYKRAKVFMDGFWDTLERKGAGPVLVYLHGAFGLQWSMPLVQAMAQHHTVIAPHLPGHGNSEGLERIAATLIR